MDQPENWDLNQLEWLANWPASTCNGKIAWVTYQDVLRRKLSCNFPPAISILHSPPLLLPLHSSFVFASIPAPKSTTFFIPCVVDVLLFSGSIAAVGGNKAMKTDPIWESGKCHQRICLLKFCRWLVLARRSDKLLSHSSFTTNIIALSSTYARWFWSLRLISVKYFGGVEKEGWWLKMATIMNTDLKKETAWESDW